MYDIRQFRPALFALLLLGSTGFALASDSAAVWVVCAGCVLLNAWLVYTGRFRPMPRLIANAVTLLGLLFLVASVQRGTTTPIIVIAQFLVLLQLVKLYEQRSNRDYAQLLVLSLLLMVAAAISTASLTFGLLLIGYLVLSLYCCLLFHLKVETDHAKVALGLSEEKMNPTTLRQDQTYLASSMRRLTVLVAVFAISTAALTFLLFPRGSVGGLVGPLQWRPAQALTGFSETVSFQNVAKLASNPQPIAWIKITRGGSGGAPYHPASPILLRGVTLDYYTGAGDADRGNSFQWMRTAKDTSVEDFGSDQLRRLGQGEDLGNGADPAALLVQNVTLDPTGTNTLFALGGITQFKPGDGGRFRYSREDETIQSTEPINQRIQYQIVSSGVLVAQPVSASRIVRRAVSSLARGARSIGRDDAPGDSERGDGGAAGAGTSSIDPAIVAYAERPDVSGSDDQGPLAARRPRGLPVTELDAQIAQAIERHLQTQFTYTTDLTDARRINDRRDPLVAFLYDIKRGHCEYFAGAMTLLCQSLGLQARVVVGFKCDDFNTVGEYYTVRQSHAHAWVEVLDSAGVWQTYDPTSNRDLRDQQRAESIFHRIKSFFNFLEYSWANSVVAYDRETRTNLIRRVDQNLSDTAMVSSDAFSRTIDWINQKSAMISSNLLAGIIGLMIVAIFAAVSWYLIEQYRLRRRARRIGLDTLPASDQLRLARQLGFYDDLTRLLERYKIARPAHFTPLEFSDSLTFLPVDAFEGVKRLTEIFYRVRYGRAQLSAIQQRNLVDSISSIESILSRKR